MSTIAERVWDQTDLAPPEVAHLHHFLGAWQLIADLSFADLLLWCRLSASQGFVCLGQLRPVTAQTLHPEDAFARVVRPEELPIIDRAFAEGRSWRRDEPVLVDGLQVRMEAVPVPYEGRVIAVMTMEGIPLGHRRPGQLEQTYLSCALALTRMVQEGNFPFEGEALDPELSPRVGDGFLRLDSEGRVLYASPNAVSAYRRLGVVSNIVGERLADIGVEPSLAWAALHMGTPLEAEVEVGSTVVLQRAVPFLRGPHRDVVGGMLLVRDVTELRHRERMLARQEAVIQEIHHRVKNNLQTIASLLRLQARRLGNPEARGALEEAQRRIASIALVHETLSRDPREAVEFGEVGRAIIRMVADGLTLPDRRVDIRFEGDPGELPAEVATPLAVVLVELVQNAVEHAFGPGGGTVVARMSQEPGFVRLLVEDDGEGLPEGFNLAESGLGLQIVRALVGSELHGKINISSGASNGGNPGVTAVVDIPLRIGERQRDG
ncbi:MAG TPA: histidine kinase N-terminal domain-containing protein [Actinomycetota bacterium]|nr:two-component system, sensor histidine kinase PdtaS [Actinomycetota bacterium]